MEYELKLTEREIKIIGAALVKLPFEVVVEVINKINSQIAKIETLAKSTESE